MSQDTILLQAIPPDKPKACQRTVRDPILVEKQLEIGHFYRYHDKKYCFRVSSNESIGDLWYEIPGIFPLIGEYEERRKTDRDSSKPEK